MDAYMEHMRRLADIARESNYALWNALLTVEGMFAGVFSAVAIFSTVPKILSFLIVLTAILSAGLLIFNFHTTRNVYIFMGELGRDPENIAKLSDSEK
jgi:hypothetical protein